jgi:hypothetical protein
MKYINRTIYIIVVIAAAMVGMYIGSTAPAPYHYHYARMLGIQTPLISGVELLNSPAYGGGEEILTLSKVGIGDDAQDEVMRRLSRMIARAKPKQGKGTWEDIGGDETKHENHVRIFLGGQPPIFMSIREDGHAILYDVYPTYFEDRKRHIVAHLVSRELFGVIEEIFKDALLSSRNESNMVEDDIEPERN